MDVSDETLFDRGRSGHTDAYRTLFERYASLLRVRFDRGLPPYLRRKISSADLIQETRLTVFERAHSFEDRGPGSFRAWLLAIATLKLREALRHHVGTRKRAVGREVTRGQRPDSALFAGQQASPSQHAIAAETAEIADLAFEQLPDDYREILQLVREEQLTLREAGERMGRSREAAKKLYARAVVAFTRLFERAKGNGHA